jgi:transcriptional regulator with XRE-family HTH domain
MPTIIYSPAVPDRAAKLQRQFGSLLRSQRQAAALTQQEVAFRAGLSLTYVGEIERGERMVSLDTIVRLSDALGQNVSVFLKHGGF